MIFVFRIISPEDDGFVRDIETGAKNSFLSLHNAIQEALGYDSTQLTSFFPCDSGWNRLEEITLVDMHDTPANHQLIMENVLLEDKSEKKGDRFQYLHDYFSDRAFFIELTETLPEGNDHSPARVVRSQGNPPPQILLDLPLQDEEGFDPDDFDFDPDNEDGFFDPDDLEQL